MTATKTKKPAKKTEKPDTIQNQFDAEQKQKSKAPQRETIVLNSKKADLFSVYIQADQDPIRIAPGIGEFKAELWMEARHNPIVMQRLAEGSLVEVKDPTTGDFLENIPDNLLAFPDMAAAEMADGMMDMDTLEDWLEEEKRPGIKKAINAQIQKIEQFTARMKAANSKK